MKIGITGSAGFLGANLVKHLSEQSSGPCTAFCSRRSANPLTDHLAPAYEHLDVTSREEVLQKTRGLDVLYHVAGMVDYSKANRARTWDVNVIGTKNIIDAVAANGIGKLVYVSSISVLGVPCTEGLADERNDRYAKGRNPVSFPDASAALDAVRASLGGDYSFLRRMCVPYFDSKLAAFELAMEAAREKGLPIVVVLPGTAVGEGDTALALAGLVHRVFQGRLFFTLPGGTSFVSARDVARGTALAAGRGRHGEAYIVTGHEEDNMRYGQFMRLVAEVAREEGGHPPGGFLTVPRSVARMLAAASEAFAPRTSLPQGLALSGSVTHRCSFAKAERELGYRPSVSLRQSVRDCIAFTLKTIGENPHEP
jgi:dihydroflavonol-4-reductase